MFNLVGWALLVLLFAILRRTAGNYGRLALVRKDDDESKWTQLFFAPDEVNVQVGSFSLLFGLHGWFHFICDVHFSWLSL